MKCDRLKVYVPQDGPYGLEPEEGGKLVEEETCYLKSDVDAAIDDLKTAHHKERHEYIRMIADLKEKLEDAKATAYADSVDAGMRERKLKRALWLARAEKAKTAKNMFDILWKFASREKVGVTGCAHKIKGAKTLKEPKFFFAKFQIAENKCIEKAEEYK